MGIEFSDFVGNIMKDGVFSECAAHPVESAVASANKWIKDNSIKVINVETVIVVGTASLSPSSVSPIVKLPAGIRTMLPGIGCENAR